MHTSPSPLILRAKLAWGSANPAKSSPGTLTYYSLLPHPALQQTHCGPGWRQDGSGHGQKCCCSWHGQGSVSSMSKDLLTLHGRELHPGAAGVPCPCSVPLLGHGSWPPQGAATLLCTSVVSPSDFRERQERQAVTFIPFIIKHQMKRSHTHIHARTRKKKKGEGKKERNRPVEDCYFGGNTDRVQLGSWPEHGHKSLAKKLNQTADN